MQFIKNRLLRLDANFDIAIWFDGVMCHHTGKT